MKKFIFNTIFKLYLFITYKVSDKLTKCRSTEIVDWYAIKLPFDYWVQILEYGDIDIRIAKTNNL